MSDIESDPKKNVSVLYYKVFLSSDFVLPRNPKTSLLRALAEHGGSTLSGEPYSLQCYMALKSVRRRKLLETP